MNHLNNHCSTDQLHALIDRQLDSGEHTRVTDHLQTCPDCRSRYDLLVRFDAALKGMPLFTVSSDFTRALMAKLRLVPQTPFTFRMLGHMADLFGLLIVLGMLVTVFVLTGVIGPVQMGEGKGVASDLLTQVGSGISSATGILSTWLAGFFPFVFGKGAFALSFVVILVVVTLAVVDRSVARRFAQKFR
jgi:anti-sigma factor RsiW